MGTHYNEKLNYPPSEGRPLFGVAPTEMKTPSGDYQPPQGGYSSAQGLPITTQPVSQTGAPSSNWMPIPRGIPNCPPGLEYLAMVDQLHVNRKLKIEWIINKKEYEITNSLGEKIYDGLIVLELSCDKCCDISSAYDMKILDNFGNEVISLNRVVDTEKCCAGCPMAIEISSPPGSVCGVVEQKWGCFVKFVVKNSNGDIVLRIEGPSCSAMCCEDINYMILSADGYTEVGKIFKKWVGCITWPDENVFGIQFPMDLDVRMKAVLLGASILIKILYFEKRK